MAKNRSEKSRYPSRYSPAGWVTAAQYITEFICEKKAKQDNRDLPVQFWNIPEWAKFYRFQVKAANELVKEFLPAAVIAALKDQRAWRIYSLNAPHLRPLVEEHQKAELAKLERQKLEKEDTRQGDISLSHSPASGSVRKPFRF